MICCAGTEPLFGGELLDDQQLEYMTTLRGGYSCGWQEDGFDGLGHGGTTPSYNSCNAVIEAENGERFYAV